MSAESPGARDRFSHWRQSFQMWRWQRPFWAGLLTLLAGLPIAYFPYANLTVSQVTLRIATTAGSASLVIGVLLIVLGLTMWFQAVARVFAGVAAILLAIVSLVVSNFGGFGLGCLLALIGGGMAVAWAPGTVPAERVDGEGEEEPEPLPEDDVAAAREPTAAAAVSDDDSTDGRHRAV
ncbi:DUF6114 domain-containing protein [Streptomyces sp. TP-A0874]|uniref:DUF6114 domain-containing protein n=1 Tax=Streptomyces sp. TP-A0874 TaxID=549819 RepID=UPI000853AD4B|nr:DUF6114 domain-containing protein [Streptomyces sp. TP-A0874]